MAKRPLRKSKPDEFTAWKRQAIERAREQERAFFFRRGDTLPTNSIGGLREFISTNALDNDQLKQELAASLSSPADWIYDTGRDRVQIGGKWFDGRQAARWRQKQQVALANQQALLSKEQARMSMGNIPNPWGQQNFTSASSNASSYTQMLTGSGAPYGSPMPNWHSFMCGHQIKLEQGQPIPSRCTICPPPKLLVHTYPKCGHALSYQEGTPIPSICQTCASEAARLANLAQLEVQRKHDEEKKRREDEKDLRVWLDRQISEVRLPVAQVLDPALPF